MELFYTSRFLKSLRKLPSLVQNDVISSVEEFKNKNNHQRLNLHKLHGEMKMYHAFSVNFYYRVVIKISKDNVHFMDVGTHDVYK